jgi:hypothetical protein
MPQHEHMSLQQYFPDARSNPKACSKVQEHSGEVETLTRNCAEVSGRSVLRSIIT